MDSATSLLLWSKLEILFVISLNCSLYFIGGQRFRLFLKEHCLYIAGRSRKAVYYNEMSMTFYHKTRYAPLSHFFLSRILIRMLHVPYTLRL
jgi:hypothetical protein